MLKEFWECFSIGGLVLLFGITVLYTYKYMFGEPNLQYIAEATGFVSLCICLGYVTKQVVKNHEQN